MEFRNFTPFPALAYQALDQHDRLYHVVAMRQTLSIAGDGQLTYPNDQEPLAVEDEYFGEINLSSVRHESDLAPFKPKCDVILVATAHAPGGIPAPRFEARLRISEPSGRTPNVETDPATTNIVLEKTLVITGPRFWQRSQVFRTWKLSNPEPIISLPVRYEYAYGGELKLEDAAGQQQAIESGDDPKSVPALRHTVVEANPVGRGFSEDWFLKATTLDRIPAPQIEDPVAPVTPFDQHYAPQGFGVITKAWLPRRQLAGTADEAFAKSDRWLPEDFDFAFWNGAHPDLQVPYLRGDEIVELTNLTADGEFQFHLPGHRPFVLVRYESGEIEPIAANLDTLIVDAEAGKVALVHRLIIPTDPAVRVVEARLITKSEWDAARQSVVNATNESPAQVGAGVSTS